MLQTPLRSSSPYGEFTQLFNTYGGQQYLIGESITQKSHALQAAAISQMAGAPENFTIGMLLHDIGQIANAALAGKTEALHYSHAELGEEWLAKRGFPPQVCKIAGYHTIAKVLLCEEDDTYRQHLSSASVSSLAVQKLKYSQPEFQAAVNHFKSSPWAGYYKRARKVDDMAKINDLDTETGLPDFEAYRHMTRRVWAGEGRPSTDEDWMVRVDKLFQEMVTDFDGFAEQVRRFTQS